MNPEALNILDAMKQLLLDEQRLFGDFLLSDKKEVQSVATAKQEKQFTVPDTLVVSEPMLFAVPGISTPKSSSESWTSSATLDELNQRICSCLNCSLGHTRTKFVFGVGNPLASLMIIGEAPGADEDAQGEPFVGRAGQLLNKILEAIGFKRSDVYICNILKCRPPGNRKPTTEESETCKPYLKKQIELVKPKVILCLGLTAAENLLGTKESMAKLRGRTMSYEGVPVMVTYHPAALLRNPNWKRPAWEDVQALKKLHDKLLAY